MRPGGANTHLRRERSEPKLALPSDADGQREDDRRRAASGHDPCRDRLPGHFSRAGIIAHVRAICAPLHSGLHASPTGPHLALLSLHTGASVSCKTAWTRARDWGGGGACSCLALAPQSAHEHPPFRSTVKCRVPPIGHTPQDSGFRATQRRSFAAQESTKFGISGTCYTGATPRSAYLTTSL
jgi:hypothetical protein